MNKVLYIEDDQEDLQRMIAGLETSSFELVTEIYGEKALSRLESDRDRIIKSVLLDAVELKDPVTQLPQQFQGEEIARKIRQTRPDLPIFAVSWFRQSGFNFAVDGVYPKATLFASPSTFKDLENAIRDAIDKSEQHQSYPEDGGGARWRQKWGPDYIEFRNNQSFETDVTIIGRRSRQDYDLLANNEIKETYRKYRGIDSLKHVLIVRRVVFAAVFSSYGNENGVAWKEVSEFLGFKFPGGEVASDGEMHEGLRNLMNECGIKWGNVINRATLLTEEEEWLETEEFLP